MAEPSLDRATWTVGTPVARRKAPWQTGLTYEGLVLGKRGDPLVIAEVKHCGHRHTKRTTALACGARLAHSLNQAT